MEDEEIVVYQHQYGYSITKTLSTLDDRLAVLEQDLSVCAKRYGGGWIVFAWLDAGKPLT